MASSVSVPCPKVSSLLKINHQSQNQKVSLAFPQTSNFTSKSCSPFGSSIRVRAFSLSQRPNRKQTMVFTSHTQLNEVAEISSNSVAGVDAKPKVALPKQDNKISAENTTPDASAISTFMAQVSDLVKLVDSRDIAELQLKQLDCELVIRKKEALQPPESSSPIVMPHYMPQAMFQTPPPAAPAPASPTPPALAPLSLPPAKTSNSSHPPLKCPMAGTFYRSPAPGEPPFVKVGDKVQKGQVVCIIEAMKLMNEIEADQSGTITEILVEDGKPVSVDMPLFVVVP
ncbi:biotin carboxyl carrier protein of acetyl-CoA carboxylase 2, chloroplastic-like isoform X1 [Hibiscus syriacus]|uniref:biotin carboxyl carrier protein of acetyl-CoA carboxylase 2, chloroplastic-like isoform X1 n=1 Tax=Hibiscus syriacus TaxID=106335 RepID=UPI001920E08C|nr:biotin carboxyl carrier protein of acetyl-CoA carboxylase 2, chloroplastic-like isoform X1 [Hibiscus syriacus]